MAEPAEKPKTDKPSGPPKLTIKVNDVSPADKSAPDPSAKPIIVTNRPMMKDPMVKEEAKEPKQEVKRELKLPVKADEASKETPAAEEPKEETPKAEAAAPAEPAEEKPAEADAPSEKTATEAPDDSAEQKKDSQPDAEALEAAEEAKQAEQAAAMQKLADEKKYYLPINAVEKRKSRRFVLLGLVLSLLLVLAWADIALDSGLVHISGIKPVTHFFSN